MTWINNETRTINTDVLVLGAGAAGSGAMIAASEQGARVLVVEKGKLESSGAMGGGNDHFMANLNTGPAWDSDEALINFFKGATNGATPSMVANGWASPMPYMVKMLEDAGMEFVRNSDGTYLRTTGFGQPGPWYLNINKGQLAKRIIARKIRGMKIDVLDHVMVTKLLTDGNQVAGAMGFNVLDGTFYVLKAKTVVMALGNRNARATTNSTRNPFNVWMSPYCTGSYSVLGYWSGAKIINLDVDQFATLLPKGYGAPGMNGINSMGGHELNALGERFMGKYDPKGENGLRRNQVLGTYQEIMEGKGPPIVLDMRHFSKDDIDLIENVLMPGDKATYSDWMKQKGTSFATHPLEAELSEISFGGKLWMNERFESTLSGLYSGCNFFGFSGAICGGYSAGARAAKAARSMSEMPQTDADAIRQEKARLFGPLGKRDGITPRTFEDAIRQVMDYYMSFVRSERGMEVALEKLEFIQTYENDIVAKDLRELMRTQEAVHSLAQCQLTTLSCMQRKESGRTVWRRSDYPNLDPEFTNKCVAIWQEHGQPKTALEILE